MSDTRSGPPKRPPQVFDGDDPALVVEATPAPEAAVPPGMRPRQPAGVQAAAASGAPADVDAPTGAERRSMRPGWLSVLLAAASALVGLAVAMAFADIVLPLLRREDWIGITAWVLLGIALLATLMIVGREIIGLMRLGRLAGLRREAEQAQRSRDVRAEKAVVQRLRNLYAARRDLAWAAARFAEHERDVRDPGDLLALADRELVAPLDAEARRMILASAKRVSLVTVMSPMAAISVGFVMVENLRLLRRLAMLYGGRPGFLGGLRLARMVLVHILATGGVALTDDLIGQFLGQDLMRRLSRRLGEGLFNGALTARIGVAALDVCRPLPFVEARPVRIRDILAELTRRTGEPAQR